MNTFEDIEKLEIAIIEIDYQMSNAKDAMKIALEEFDASLANYVVIDNKIEEVEKSLGLVKRLIKNLEA